MGFWFVLIYYCIAWDKWLIFEIQIIPFYGSHLMYTFVFDSQAIWLSYFITENFNSDVHKNMFGELPDFLGIHILLSFGMVMNQVADVYLSIPRILWMINSFKRQCLLRVNYSTDDKLMCSTFCTRHNKNEFVKFSARVQSGTAEVAYSLLKLSLWVCLNNWLFLGRINTHLCVINGFV